MSNIKGDGLQVQFCQGHDIAITGRKMKELYSRDIMAFAANIPCVGRLSAPAGQGMAHSRLCGSRISVSLNMDGEVVGEYAQEVRACLVGQAAAAIVGHNIIGSSRREIADIRERVRLMLEEGCEAPDGKWSDFALLAPVRKYKSRYSTVLIVFDAVIEAMDMAASSRETSSE